MKFDENGNIEEDEEEEEEKTVVSDINLNGQVIIIYSRDEDEPDCISNFGIILKGEWDMGVKDKQEDFIYKRLSVPENEGLLTELFCEDKEDRLAIPDLSKTFAFNPLDPK